MDKLEKEINKIKTETEKVRKCPNKNTKKEIKENYKIGIEYYEDVEKHIDNN